MTSTIENISKHVPEIIKNEIFNSELNKAKEIYEKLKIIYKDKPELLEKFKKEYQDVIDSRNYALQENSIEWKILTSKELDMLKKEVKDLKNIINIIEKFKNKADEILKKLKNDLWENSKEYKLAINEYNEIKDKINLALKDGKIDKIEFNQIAKEYSDLKKVEYNSKWFFSKSFWAIYNTVNETLLEFDIDENNEIIWYKNWEHFIIKIEEFEKQLKDENIRVSELNSKWLSNYLEYLKSKWKLNIKTLEEKFWKEKLKELSELWKNNKWDTITQKLLGELWLDSIIEKVISFSDIIKNPEETIPKLTKIPTKEEIKETPFSDLQDFHEKYNGTCPLLPEEDIKKFYNILSLSKKAEIEIIWENNFKKEFISVIKEKIKDKKLSKKQEEILLEEAEKNYKSIFDKWLEKLNNSEEACWFELTIFIQGEINKFLEKNGLSTITEKDRQKLAKIITATHLEIKKEETKTIQQETESLESKKNKTPEEIKKLEELKNKLIRKKQEVEKAKRIVETSQASDKEIEEYLNIIKNWWTKEEAYKNFKENRKNTKFLGDDINNNFYKTKTINYPNWDTLAYIQTPDWYNIDNWKEWNEGINITKNEFDTIKNNPQNLKNLLEFKKTLSELNIDFIWDNRFEFIKKLNTIDPSLNIKIDKENYINNTELKKILNSIISLVWENKSKINDLDTIKTKLRDISKSWIDDTKKDIIWSPLEKIFIKKWIIDKNSSLNYFNINKIEENYGTV